MSYFNNRKNYVISSFTWLAKKLFRMLTLLAAVSIIAFTLATLSPVDPLAVNIGQTALGSLSQAQIDQLARYWGVHEPPVQRYLAWAGGFVRGDMGMSLLYRQPVVTVIGERLSNSIWILVFAWLFSGILGFALGILAGANQGRWLDKVIRSCSLITNSMPIFWLALLLLLLFSVWLRILPIGLSAPIGMAASSVRFLDRLAHALLPALTLSIAGIPSMVLHTREKMIDVMRSDYMRYAMARGESKWNIIRRHGLRNVLLPTISLQFVSVGEIIGGSVLVEQVFSYPGLGQAAVTAGLGGDIPLLLSIVLLGAGMVFGGNLIADILCRLIDPRMRREEG